MNCLQIGAEWLPERAGGLNRFYFDLLHHLPAAGVQCRGLVAGRPDTWPADPDVRVDAFAPMQSPLPKRWWAVRQTVNGELSAGHADLIAAHFAPYAYLPLLDKIGPALPLVFHFQGPWAQEAREEGENQFVCAAKAFIEKSVYRRATRLIVLSGAFKRILVETYGIPAERIHVVPGGVDCDRFAIAPTRAEARARLGWPAGRPTVLAVRRLVKRMGLENLIEAARAVRDAVPDVLVLIAGGGKERDRLADAIRAQGLDDTVRLLGFVPDADLPLAYRAADLTVVPTVSLEGFGLVAAESLAAGTPALATPVDGLVDLLSGLQHLLFAGATAADIAAGLTAGLVGQHPLPSPSECAGYARRRFDWPVIAAGVADVYRDAVRLC